MSNTSSATVVDTGLMDWERWLQVVGFQFIIGGVLSLITNLAVGIGIAKSKNLRTRFYVSLCFLLLTRATIAFQYVVRCTYVVLQMANILPLAIPLIVCQHLHFFINLCSFTDELLLLFLIIDRTLAILGPIYYRRLTVRQAIWTCIGLELLAAVVRLTPAYIDVQYLKLVNCVSILNGLPKVFQAELQQLSLVPVILGVVLYVLMMSVTYWRVRTMRRLALETDHYVALKRQMALLPVLRNTAGCHVTLALLTRFSLAMGSLLPSNGTRFFAYGSVLQCFDLLLGSLIMVLSKTELRRAVLPSGSTKSSN